MTLTLAPDIEKVVFEYLRDHADIAPLNTRVVGKTPDDTAASWARVTQLDASQTDQADHLSDFLLQIDCYPSATGLDGSQQKEVSLLARTVRAAMRDMPGIRSGTVVTGVRVTGDARVPDTDFEPARERRILTIQVWAHA